jgi:hypothetical protein
MHNRKKIITILAVLFFLSVSGRTVLNAQNTDALGTFTPYSLFGIGDINRSGTAYNQAMGGIGIGLRENRNINFLNPASFTKRDTLSFMMDFGGEQKNMIGSTDNAKRAHNSFNMHHLVLSFPLYEKSAMGVGVAPYSSVGYDFTEYETDPSVINQVGDVMYQRYGSGGINKAFLSASMVFLRNFSVGAEGIFYFGNINRSSDILFNSDASYRSVNSGTEYVVRSTSAKFGLQYEKNIREDISFTAGATWLMGTELGGDVTRYAFSTNSSGYRDTSYFSVTDGTSMEIPSELGVGFSIRKADKWLFGADYTRQDWSGVSFPTTSGVDFSPAVRNTFKAGFEYIPNRYDVRYYRRRVTYRGGLYYSNTYMKLNGKQINSMGVTLGATLPILNLYNGLGFSVDMGQRGSLKNNLVRERYVIFNISVSLHDLWFIKYKYD